MINYFVWFKIDGDIDNQKKANYSKNVHDFLFKSGKKLHRKSNAFFYKSDWDAERISDTILEMSNKKIKLIVIKMETYQGYLPSEYWDFLK